MPEQPKTAMVVKNSNGDIAIEVHTAFGHVRNLLDAAGGPESSDQTVEVRGQTSYGDITIRRS
jgi:hypothetical protein